MHKTNLHTCAPNRWQRWRGDINASLVVFLMGLPLALGISLTIDAPLSAGLVAAMVGGMICGVVGGVPTQISGPAVGVTLVSAHVGQQYGFAAMCWVTGVAGLLQLLISALGWAKYGRHFPAPVLHGMLAGIGISIVATQSHVMLGTKGGGSVVSSLMRLPGAFFAQDVRLPLAVGLLTLAINSLWRRNQWLSEIVPAALASVVLAALTVGLLDLDLARVRLPAGLWSQGPRGLPQMPWPSLLLNAAGLALMASLYTTLCALALQPLVPRLRNAPIRLDRELLAQGCANLASGALGGLPVTGVLARSVANLRAGASSCLPNFLQGLWLLACLSLGAGWLQRVPLASLAALFVAVGLSLIKPSELRAAYGRGLALPYLLAGLMVVRYNLLVGAFLGCLTAYLLQRLGAATDGVRPAADDQAGRRTKRRAA